MRWVSEIGMPPMIPANARADNPDWGASNPESLVGLHLVVPS